MSFADRVEQQRSGEYTINVARRHRELAIQNDIDARSAARRNGLNPLSRGDYYEHALSWLCADAALRQAQLEAQTRLAAERCVELEQQLLATRPVPVSVSDAAQDPAPPPAAPNGSRSGSRPFTGAEKEAHSHAERGTR